MELDDRSLKIIRSNDYNVMKVSWNISRAVREYINRDITY